MVDSLKHRRFGLFGTERTGAGIITRGQFDRLPPTTGYGGSRSGDLGGGGGGGPDWRQPSGVFRVLGSPSLPVHPKGTAIVNDSPTRPDYSRIGVWVEE